MKRIVLGIVLGMLYISRLVWTGFNGVQYEAIVVFGLLGWMTWSGVKAVKRSKQQTKGEIK